VPPLRRVLAILASCLWMASLPAWAEEPVCPAVAKLPLERHLRQLTLDLLGRPPTVEEYRAVQARGAVTEEDVRALMAQDAFYTRIREYHRALLWSNVSASVFNNRDTRPGGTGTVGDVLGMRNTSSSALRGANGQGCDSFIPQDTCDSAPRQDPHAETGTKACYDERGVPLPVSWDYDSNFYGCIRLDENPVDATLTSCQLAVDKGRLPAKHLLFCDMRRVSGKLVPHLCLPRPDKNTTMGLTVEELDAQGRVTAFLPGPSAPSTTLSRLDRCTLTLNLRNKVKGAWEAQRGCLQREGYVMRPAPFWSGTGGEVAVCAIEAQARAANPYTLESCEASRFARDRSCGCGERMRRCEAPDGSTHNARVEAINDEPELIAESVVRRDEPYFNLLTTRRSFINGPLSELYRQSQGVGVFSLSPPVDVAALPAVPFSEAGTWEEYTRAPEHSGVLTTASYLYRFPTQRARVNHFYEAFLCKAFSPPDDARLPSAEDACNRENNLAKRCGCNSCHATLEPTGAHWGRFSERGAQYLSPELFPRYDPKCRDCALSGNTSCGGECGQYVMQAYDGDGASSLGLLKTYLYRTAAEEQNIDGGPRLLVERMLQTGELERCAVKRVWREFLGRPMTGEEQRLYLEPMARDFARDGHRFKALIERVVMSDAYRRMD